MAYQRALVIINPVAGRHDPNETRRVFEDVLERERIQYEIRETQATGDALRWGEQAEHDGFDIVIVSGGDGTVMEAMSGLIKGGGRVPLAQIPVGTANTLAAALLIPNGQDEALRIALTGKAIRLDVGYLPEHDRYFALVAGAGYDAKVMADASRELKNALGFGAYLITGVKNLFNLRRARLDIQLDDRRLRLRAHTVMIVNVWQIGNSGLQIGPGIHPHDGKLDLIVMSSASVWGAVNVLFRILTQRFEGHSDLRYFSASRVRVTSRPPLPTEIDGEPLGQTPLYAEAIPEGALLIVPQEYQTRETAEG